jgi:hypothetical protein
MTSWHAVKKTEAESVRAAAKLSLENVNEEVARLKAQRGALEEISSGPSPWSSK